MTRHKPCDIQNRWSTMFCFLSWYICHAICYLYKKLTHVFAWAQIYYLRPYLGTEIILCHLSLQMAWMDKVWNLKKLGQLFQVSMSCLKKSPKYCYGQCFPIKFVLCLLLKYTQGYPMTVFCQISVRRGKNCLEFSIACGRIKISRWPFHSCTIFEAYLTNSLRFSQV